MQRMVTFLVRTTRCVSAASAALGKHPNGTEPRAALPADRRESSIRRGVRRMQTLVRLQFWSRLGRSSTDVRQNRRLTLSETAVGQAPWPRHPPCDRVGKRALSRDRSGPTENHSGQHTGRTVHIAGGCPSALPRLEPAREHPKPLD